MCDELSRVSLGDWLAMIGLVELAFSLCQRSPRMIGHAVNREWTNPTGMRMVVIIGVIRAERISLQSAWITEHDGAFRTDSDK